MKDTDHAWAAGFIEGDGSIMLSRARRWYNVKVAAHQRNPAPLRRLQEMYGGSVYLERSNNLWCWLVTNRKAKTVLESIRPYLVSKTDQADLALDFQARRGLGYDQERDAADHARLSAMKKEEYGEQAAA